MKLSLLDITQNILSALDSDPVSSIDETVESVQVADLVKEAYYDLMSQRDWPFLRELGTLAGLADLTRPTTMLMPENVNKVIWIKYRKQEVAYMPPATFQDMIDGREALANVIDANGYGLNGNPTYWTSFNDEHVVFDSVDKTLEDTLHEAQTNVYLVRAPTWSHVDAFVPDLPDKFFPTLLAEAKAQAFVNLKQQSNVREEKKAQRGRVTMQNESWRNENGEVKYNSKVNYGRM